MARRCVSADDSCGSAAACTHCSDVRSKADEIMLSKLFEMNDEKGRSDSVYL